MSYSRKSAKLQRNKERFKKIKTERASRIKTSDKNGQIICPFFPEFYFYFNNRRASFKDLRSSVKVSDKSCVVMNQATKRLHFIYAYKLFSFMNVTN